MGSESCEIDPSGSPPTRSYRFVVVAIRAIGWIVVVVGFLVLAVRLYRAAVEGVHSVPWGLILFLAPFAEISSGLLWILGAKFLQRKHWYPAAGLVASGIVATVAAFMLTNWLYDRFEQLAEYQVKPSAWVEFKVPGTPISVEVPHQPALEMHDIDSPIGNIPADIYMAEQGAVVFVIAISAYPRGTVAAIDPEGRNFLVHMSDAAIASRPGSKLLVRRPIELERWSGLEEQVELPAGRSNELKPEKPIVAWQRYYQSGDRMLQFKVMTLKSDYDADAEEFEQTASRFFQSIQIEASI